MIRPAHLHVNRVLAHVRVRRSFGQVERRAVGRVANHVARLRPGQREPVRLRVVRQAPARERKVVDVVFVNRSVQRLRNRRDVIRRRVSGCSRRDRVRHRDVPRPDFGTGERARDRHDDFIGVGGHDPAHCAERDLGVGRPVVNLVRDRRARDRQLFLLDRRAHRRVGNRVVPGVRARNRTAHRDRFVFARVGVGKRARNAADRHLVPRHESVEPGESHARRIRRVVNLVRSDVTERQAPGRDIGAHRRRADRVVPRVRARSREVHRHSFAGSDVLVGERRRVDRHRHVVAGNESLERGERRLGVRVPVVDFVLRREVHRQFFRGDVRRHVGDRQVIVVEVDSRNRVAGDRHRLVGADVLVGERAGVARSLRRLARGKTGEFVVRNRRRDAAVVDLIDGRKGQRQIGLRDVRLGLGDRQLVVVEVDSGNRVPGDRHRFVGAGVRVGERAGVTRNFRRLARGQTGEFVTGNRRRGRAVVDFVVGRKGERQRRFRDVGRRRRAADHVVPRVRARSRKVDRHGFTRPDVRVGERSRIDRHRHVVAGNESVKRGESRLGVGRPVVDFVFGGEVHRQRLRRNVGGDVRDRQFVVIEVDSGNRVAGNRHRFVGAGVLVGERAGVARRFRRLARGQTGEFVTGNLGSGRAVINFVFCRKGQRQRRLRDVGRRTVVGDHVVPRVRARDGIDDRHGLSRADGGVGERRRRDRHRQIVAGDFTGEPAQSDLGVGGTVVNLALGGHRRDDRLRRDVGGRLRVGDKRIVPRLRAAEHVDQIDRLLLADVPIGKRPFDRHRHVVAGNDPANLGGERHNGRPVVNLVGGGRHGGNLRRGDRQRRAPRPIGVVFAAHLRVNRVHARVRELGNAGRVGLAVDRIENGVGRQSAGDFDRTRRRVIDILGVRKRDLRDRKRRDLRADRVGRRGDIVRRVGAAQCVADRHVVHADFRRRERARRRHADRVAVDDAGERADRDRRVGRAVVSLVGDRRAADRKLFRRNVRAHVRRGDHVVIDIRARRGIDDRHGFAGADVLIRKFGGVDRHRHVVPFDEPRERDRRGRRGRRAVVDFPFGGKVHRQGDRVDIGGRRRVRVENVIVRLNARQHVRKIDRLLFPRVLVREPAAHRHRHVVPGNHAADRRAGDRRDVSVVVFVVRRTDYRDRLRVDLQRRAPRPVGVIRAAHLYVNLVRPDVGVRRSLGQVERHAVGRVADHVARLGAGQREPVRLGVVRQFAPRERKIVDVVFVDRSVQRLCHRRDIVRRRGAREGVRHRNVPRADFGTGERARNRHGDLTRVGGENPAHLAERDLGVGRPVVNLVRDRRAGDRQLLLLDRRAHRFVGDRVVPGVRARNRAAHRDRLVFARARVGKRARNFGHEDPVARRQTDEFGKRHAGRGRRVVDFVGSDIAERQTPGRNVGRRRRRAQDVIPRVGARRREVDRHSFPRADVLVGERRRVDRHRHVVAVKETGKRIAADRGVRRPVVDFVLRREVHRQRRRSDCQRRASRPVEEMLVLNLRVDLVNAGVREFGQRGAVRLAVDRIENHVPFPRAADRNRTSRRVIDVFRAVERDPVDDFPLDHRGQRLAGRRDIIPRAVARNRIGHGDVVLADFRRRKLPRRVDRDLIARNDPRDPAQVHRRVGRAVVILVVDRRAADRQLLRRDFAREDFAFRNVVVPRVGAAQRVAHRDLALARVRRIVQARRAQDDVVAVDQSAHLADRHRRVGRAVVDLAADRRAAHRDRLRRHRAGHLIDFLFARDVGPHHHVERVRAGVARQWRVAPRLAVKRILRPRRRTVKSDRRLIVAVVLDRRPVGVNRLLDAPQVKLAAVIAVIPRRVVFGIVVRAAAGAHRLVVPPKRIAVFGEKVAAVVHDEVRTELDRRKVEVPVDRRAGTHVDRPDLLFDFRVVLVHEDAVIEREDGAVFAADRAAVVPRHRHVRRQVRPIRRRRDPLVVPRDHRVDHFQVPAVVADRSVRRGVADEHRVRHLHVGVVPDVNRRAVRKVAVPRKGRTRNFRRRALFDEDRAAVRTRFVVGERAVDHRQARLFRRIDRAAVLTRIGSRNRDVFERQLAAVIDGAAVLRRASVFDRNVGQGRRARIDVESAVRAVGVDRDPAVPVDRDVRAAVERHRAVGQGDHAFEALGERDRHRNVERFGVGDRFANRVHVVIRIDNVVERRHHQRIDDFGRDFRADRLGNRRDVVPRQFARNGVGDLDVVDARLRRREFRRRGDRHVVVKGNDLADNHVGAGRPVIFARQNRGAVGRELKRRDLAGHPVEFLVAGGGARQNPERVRARVARHRRVAPRLAVEGVFRPDRGAVEADRRLILAVVLDRGPVNFDDLLDRADVDRAAVVAVPARRVELGVVIDALAGVHRLVLARQRIAVGGKQIAAVVEDRVQTEPDARKVVVAGDRRAAAQRQDRAAVQHDAVVEDRSRIGLAADRAAAVLRNRHVRRGRRPARRGRQALFVPRKDDVDQIQLAAVVPDRPVWRLVLNENRIRNIDRRVGPRVDRPAVRRRRVPAEIGTGNLGARPLLDENRAAVRLRGVVGKRAVDHRQVRAGRRVDRAAEFARRRIAHRHVGQGQVAG